MSKKLKIIIGSIVVCLALMIGAAVYIYNDGQKAVSSKDEEVVVEISGTNAMVLNQLDEAGLIKNKMVANIYLKLNSYSFKANTYILNKNMDLDTMFSIIESGDFDHLLKTKFTIIEGTNIPTVAEEIAKTLEITSDEVLQKWCDSEYLSSLIEKYWFLDESILNDGLMFPLEGYFAAETYFVSEKEPTIESLTTLMLDQMDTNLTEYKDEIENFTINGEKVSMHDFLTFTSIVQSESLFEEDHKKIAGVFMHRLEVGMKLQSDVTVNYANQVTKVAVTYNDLQVESKYNTYMYEGLPVGPIANVSKELIESCLHYEKTDNLFFFAIQGGEVIYTKTYEEHLAEIERYKEEGLWLQD
ncbi:MAG: endolytic transglycosylase MltG [Coprobacillaceae bacterium]